ncbi:MAG: TonB-dependent receptor family protein, partial [Bacteroidales bacterium]|nr:TonB-dependent receptor family protein [Bacteroidales bacterium]
MKYLLPVLFLGLFSANVFAQTVIVKGILVSESENKSLPFATVSVFDESNPETAVQRFASDIDGVFSTALNPGKYIFTFNSMGVNELNKTIEVSLAENPLNLGEIALTENLTELSELSVVAQRPLVRVEIDRLTYNIQDDPESATSSVLDMLRKVPLVTVDGEDNIQLRGSTNFRIYLNGRPSNMFANNPSQVLRSMPASSIKEIQVITETGARYAAEGIGGIINIITDQRADDGYTGSVGAGTNVFDQLFFGGYDANAFLTVKRGKFGFTGNISHFTHARPEQNSSLNRTDFVPLADNVFTQNSTGLSNGRGIFGSAKLSFEPDTLRLFSLSFDRFSGSWFNSGDRNVFSSGARDFNFTQISESEFDWGNLSLGLDYQRNFRKQGEMLTVSYRWQQSPDQGFSTFSIPFSEGISPFPLNYQQRNRNQADGREHTGQIDYVNPLTEKHVIEMGARFIVRRNLSESEDEFFNENTQIWELMPTRNNDLDHRQQISAGYVGYTFRLEKFSVRTGLRAEYLSQNVEFSDNEPFDNSFFDLIPSIAFSYQLQPASTLRFGYNKRIHRPGIWELNPFVSDTDPTNIHYGNPNLDPVNSHVFNVNFGHFAQKINFNASLHYSFTNNAILRHQFIQDGVVHNTVGNIGRNQNVGLHLWGSWTPITQLRMTLNGGVNYIDLQGDENFAYANSGFTGNVFFNTVYTLPGDWRLGFNGAFFSQSIGLQTVMLSQHFHSFNL